MIHRAYFRALLVVVLGCSTAAEREAEAAEEWEAARVAWERGELDAYALWTQLDARTEQGQQAAARLAAADAHYRQGVRLLRAGRPARDELAAATALAPMDPALYLSLARACREQGITLRAAEYYSKFLAVFPEGARSDTAREELGELDPDLAGVLGPAGVVVPQPPPPAASPWIPAVGGVVVGVVLAVTAFLIVQFVRGRGIALDRLVAHSPEFHPAVAYLVGSLRHELLKHRIGAARDALAKDSIDDEELSFLRGRLYGGTPLVDAWEGHLVAFRRAIGPRVDLSRDQAFRTAGQAVREIAKLEDGLKPDADASSRKRALQRLAAAHQRLVHFDERLADLVHGLVRTEIDEALLREAVAEVREEYSAGQVTLDRVEVFGPDEDVVLEVFRADLVLVLKNVVRNAILAVGRADPPRLLRVDVRVELEPTGDETVRLRVLDSNPEALDTSVLFDRRVDRGLGLVAAAVHRYGGTIDVEPAEEDGFEKAVVVSFFRTDA